MKHSSMKNSNKSCAYGGDKGKGQAYGGGAGLKSQMKQPKASGKM